MPRQAGLDKHGAYISTPLLKESAATFGPVSLIPDDAQPDEIKHEKRHQAQFGVPGWSLLKVLDAFYSGDSKPLEQDAYRHVRPSTEIVRRNKPGLASKAAQAYLRAVLGD